jgi:predicted MFS family arabinose efflux permease
MIAAGQAIGAPLVGVAADQLGIPVVFYACAAIALAGAALPLIGSSPHRKRLV